MNDPAVNGRGMPAATCSAVKLPVQRQSKEKVVGVGIHTPPIDTPLAESPWILTKITFAENALSPRCLRQPQTQRENTARCGLGLCKLTSSGVRVVHGKLRGGQLLDVSPVESRHSRHSFRSGYTVGST